MKGDNLNTESYKKNEDILFPKYILILFAN